MGITHELHVATKRHLDMLKRDFYENLSEYSAPVKSPDDFDVIQTIGNGAFGLVYLVRDKVSLEYHAMKVIDKELAIKKKQVKLLQNEKKLLQCIKFPFVISLDYFCKDNCHVYFLTSYEAGGVLISVIRKFGSLPEKLAQFYAAQMVLALEYLHHCDIIHRDIKPENVFLKLNGYLKLGDFGFSKIMKKRAWTICGTPEYLAPEIIISKGYTFAADWWSFGVLTYEMNSGYPPFYASDAMKLYDKILSGQYRFPEGITNKCRDFLKGLLQVDATKRIGGLKAGVYDIKSHVWLAETNWLLLIQQAIIPPYMPSCIQGAGDTSNFPKTSHFLTKLKKASDNKFENEFADF